MERCTKRPSLCELDDLYRCHVNANLVAFVIGGSVSDNYPLHWQGLDWEILE